MKRPKNDLAEAIKRIGLSAEKAGISLNELIVTIDAFSEISLEQEQIKNKMANVDEAFTASSKDLVEAVARASNDASKVNVSLEDLITIIDSIEYMTGRGGSVIGNGLKTIFTRLQRQSVLDELEKLGVCVSDNALDTLRSLKNLWDDMDAPLKSKVAEMIGGVYQITIVKALLKGL